MDAVVDPVVTPWSLEDLRRGFHVGRRTVLLDTTTVWVGKDKQEQSRRIEARVTAIGDEAVTLATRVWDGAGKLVAEREGRKADFEQPLAIFGRFDKARTTIRSETFELGSRSIPAMVYANRQIVDSQEQKITLWVARDIPGLVLRMRIETPRRRSDTRLIEFEDGT